MQNSIPIPISIWTTSLNSFTVVNAKGRPGTSNPGTRLPDELFFTNSFPTDFKGLQRPTTPELSAAVLVLFLSVSK
jgi:hypothetical protein